MLSLPKAHTAGAQCSVEHSEHFLALQGDINTAASDGAVQGAEKMGRAAIGLLGLAGAAALPAVVGAAGAAALPLAAAVLPAVAGLAAGAGGPGGIKG